MKYIKEALADLRNQPVIGVVTLIGTALSIFLIMIVVMTSEVKVMPIQPESYRDRMLHNPNMCVVNLEHEDWCSSSQVSYQAAKELFFDLESAEAATAYAIHNGESAGIPNRPAETITLQETDPGYWKVFDFTFLHGSPYTADSPRNSIVIDESLARDIFGTTDVVGLQLMINRYEPFTVVGVVRNVSMLASKAYARAWIPIKESSENYSSMMAMGSFSVTILAPSRGDFQKIRDEIARREAAFNLKLKAGYNSRLELNGGPFDQETAQYAKWSNIPPDTETPRRTRLIIYAILMLVPAVNLSSMTQSRLSRKISEIGVRRAFGCTRSRLIRDIITENLIITLAGGIIGLILSIIFGWLMADSILLDIYVGMVDTNISVWSLLNLRVMLWALVFCFVLNILSSGIPAWRASRINVMEAIGGFRK